MYIRDLNDGVVEGKKDDKYPKFVSAEGLIEFSTLIALFCKGISDVTLSMVLSVVRDAAEFSDPVEE